VVLVGVILTKTIYLKKDIGLVRHFSGDNMSLITFKKKTICPLIDGLPAEDFADALVVHEYQASRDKMLPDC
jgi:hypothetical protein